MEFQMGINAADDVAFYGLREKTLSLTAEQNSAEFVQNYLEEAKAANEAKQDFFSKMSHDIRTSLNVVQGNHLLVLINSILDVNQLEHGHMELTEEPFNPAECLRDSVEILRPLAEKKEQELRVSYDRWDQVVVGDSNRCMQILLNIISNAIKYTDVCGRIELSLRRLDGDVYQFVCRDNGIGMSEEFVQHICEDYVRAEDSRISKIQGTGLGMSVVRGFMELMGGRLKIESKLGEGSVFTVEIPFREASAEQREEVLHPAAEDGENGMLYNGKQVLLAEDNALNAEIAMELLQSLGFTVDWAEDGKMAAEQFEASEPGNYFAVFMDMQMPVMDGYIPKPVSVKDIISSLKEVVS